MLKVYKGCCDGMVVTLEIDPNGSNNMERSDVVDRDHAKFRCRSARVVGIENALTGETAEMATSSHDGQFCYRVGEMVEEPNYCAEIEKVCGEGIHFYLTWESAKVYALQLIGFKGYTGEIKGWHDNGQRLSHGWFKDGKFDGEWEKWHENGNMDGTRMGKCWRMGASRMGKRLGKGLRVMNNVLFWIYKLRKILLTHTPSAKQFQRNQTQKFSKKIKHKNSSQTQKLNQIIKRYVDSVQGMPRWDVGEVGNRPKRSEQLGTERCG